MSTNNLLPVSRFLFFWYPKSENVAIDLQHKDDDKKTFVKKCNVTFREIVFRLQESHIVRVEELTNENELL